VTPVKKIKRLFTKQPFERDSIYVVVKNTSIMRCPRLIDLKTQGIEHS